MKGVILAGGMGTRLLPFTKVINKHLLPVYNRPMIYFPIRTLRDMGCEDILIVTGGEHLGSFVEMLGDGSEYGVKLTYRVQNSPDGIAGALLCAEGFVDGLFPVVLGDNYFESIISLPSNPAIFITLVNDPCRFGVYDVMAKTIIEKPREPSSQMAVTGLYVYDDTVFEKIKSLVPSARGELEITDINNWYLDKGAEVLEYGGFWSDMGTIESLNEVIQHYANRAI